MPTSQRAPTLLDGFRLRLHVTNDTVVARDVRALLRGPIFEELLHSPELDSIATPWWVKAYGGRPLDELEVPHWSLKFSSSPSES